MHLSKLPSGHWRVAVKRAGRRATATRPTKAEAIHAGAEIFIRFGGTPGDAQTTTVEELTAMWFASADHLSITYRADALSAMKHLPEEFNARQLAAVTPLVVESLYRQLAAGGVSAHRVHRIHTVLSSSWKMAQRFGWATSNPFAIARKPTPPRRDVRPTTGDEVDAIIACAPVDLLLYIEVAETIGARRGELVALQWPDIGADSIKVRRARSFAAGTYALTEGKSGRKGHRTVAIDAVLADHLRTHRLEQVELALASGLPAPLWVFSTDAGVHPWRPEWPTKQWAKARRDAGVDADAKMHGLRHSVATRLLAAGVPLKTVSERLGHTRTATTSDVYGDYVPAADQAAAEIMAALRNARRSS